MSVCLPQAQSREIELPHRFEEVRAERARRSLKEYIQEAWHVVEPSTTFVSGWHLEAICEHLEAISAGEIRNLVVNVPPRHMKSLAVSVFWPTWEWINRPELRYIYSAYGQDLSVRDALKSRRLILSPWYQEHYGNNFSLTSDQNQKTRYDNDKTGYRIATGVGGMATGEGGDRLILDDPHKLADTHSDPAREEAIRFWNETMSTRGNDPETVAKVVIMQRVHERDVTGDILDKMEEGGEHYEMLVLPAQYEPSVQLDLMKLNRLGWEDPRKEQDELLWPQRFSKQSISDLQVSLGDSASGQLQQRPTDISGGIFDREWWAMQNRWNQAMRDYIPASNEPPNPNKVVARWISWDMALKDKSTSAYNAMTVFELTADYHVDVRYAWRDKLSFPKLIPIISDTAYQWNYDGKLYGVVVEDKAHGITALQTIEESTDQWLKDMMIAFPVHQSKEVRWNQAAAWARNGCVRLPEPSAEHQWLHAYEEELYSLPNAAYKDWSDTFAQGVVYLEPTISQGFWARRNQGAA